MNSTIARWHRETEHRLIDTQPYKLRSQKAYTAHVRRLLKGNGFPVVSARYDLQGNCLLCGESGRCPGVHIAPMETIHIAEGSRP